MASIINATTTNGVAVQGDNSGSLQLQTNNGTTAVTIDTNQNVGIGASSPAAKLDVNGSLNLSSLDNQDRFIQIGHSRTNSGNAFIDLIGDATYTDYGLRIIRNSSGANAESDIIQRGTGNLNLSTNEAAPIVFKTSATERMRITSGGLVYVNTTSTIADSQFSLAWNASGNVGMGFKNTFNGAFDVMRFLNYNNVQQGYINCNNSGSTTYNSGSDYRLKDNVQPMTDGLSKVMQLKPVTFNWKGDNSAGQGFIAHELAEIVPDIVNGEKDAVTEDGTIKPQGVDYGKLTAVLTAAIQELKAELDATKAEVQALKGVA